MKVLFANIPFIRWKGGEIYTGPNAGSRWPWTNPGPGFSGYAPYPFWLAWSMTYAAAHGIDCAFYDGVAQRHWSLDFTRMAFASYRPDVVVYDVATPTVGIIDGIAKWAKESFGCRNVYTGPHMKAYAERWINEPHVDHCVIGEPDIPVLDICRRGNQAKPIYRFEHLDNIDTLPDGRNFLPWRPPADLLANYYDPSMPTEKIQLTVMTSRGCPFKCSYCQWPNVMNAGRYRARSAEAVVDELRQMKTHLGGEMRSIFFDDDTWNLGKSRIEKILAGLKDLSLPWTMMGRIDTSKPELYDRMVDAGCVGMRFGVETFDQTLADNVKKSLDVQVAYENLKYLVTRYSNMEFHFTTMRNLPGEKPGSWQRDQELLQGLERLGAERNNRVHWQISDCIPFPGTELWEELVTAGHRDTLENFELYDGSPAHDGILQQTVGWLGENYRPKFHEYSGETGAPTNFPTA